MQTSYNCYIFAGDVPIEEVLEVVQLNTLTKSLLNLK